jgi:hypothetical protein
MGTEFAIMAAVVCRMFPSRLSATVALDFVLTCFILQFAMLFPFWQDCAQSFFVLFAAKEAIVAAQFDSLTMRRCYAISGIMHIICALEVAFAESFYFYTNYEVIMTVLCLAKLTGCIDYQSIKITWFRHVRN